MSAHSSPYRTLLLLASLSALVGKSYAWSNCYYDAFGVEHCDGLSYGARVGIAIAILVALLVLLLALFYARKRRLARYQQQAYSNARLAGSNNAPPQGYNGYPAQQQQGGGVYGYAPQLGQQQGYNSGQPYYEQQSQTYNYGPSAETWIPPPPKYEPPPPNSEHATKAGTGDGNPNTMSNEGPSSYEQQQQQQQGSTTGAYAPPAGPPPSVSQHQQGNDNRV